jgi:Cysteine dioxygenase type I
MVMKHSRLDEEALRSEIQKYCYFDSSISYTRNLISTDNDNYTLLLLCWNNNNQRSPIHNHPGDGCYMRVVSGSIVEQLYDVRQHAHTSSASTNKHVSRDENAIPVALECIATNHYGTNQIAFIDDNIGYHSIGCSPVNVNGTAHGSSNDSASIPGAMSLHLYCPPIKQCRIVVRTSSVASNVPDVGCSNDYKQSMLYVRDSGPMYHHTEYGCRNE